VAAQCMTAVLTSWIREAGSNRLEDEEDWNEEKEEGGGVVVWGVRKQEEHYGDDGGQEGECLHSANF
jgi:hypothetical protein